MAPLPETGFKVGIVNDLGEDDRIGLSKRFVGGGQVVLVLSSKVTWWKGICNGNWEMLSTQDARMGPQSGRFTETDLIGAGLYKAKAFGVHTYMYPLRVEGGLVPGYEYHFTWIKD
jgi:hypothetical protein